MWAKTRHPWVTSGSLPASFLTAQEAESSARDFSNISRTRDTPDGVSSSTLSGIIPVRRPWVAARVAPAAQLPVVYPYLKLSI